MAAEVREHAVHWMSPVDVIPGQLLTNLRRTVNEENANHPRVLMMLFEDGSVISVPHDMPQKELDAMCTKADDSKKNTTGLVRAHCA